MGVTNYLLTGMILQVVDDTCYLEIVFDDVEKVSLKLSKLERCPNMVPAPQKKSSKYCSLYLFKFLAGFYGVGDLSEHFKLHLLMHVMQDFLSRDMDRCFSTENPLNGTSQPRIKGPS